MRAGIAAFVAGAALLLPASSVAATPDPPIEPTWHRIAGIVARTPAYQAQCTGRVIRRLDTRAVFGPGTLQLRVLGRRIVTDASGERSMCLLVASPFRGGPRRFWISDRHVQMKLTRWSVRIDRSDRMLTVYRGGSPHRRWRVVVGASSTPTPLGRFGIQGATRPVGSIYGPGIIAFAYSRVLDQFDGGPGRVAMHGRSGPLLADPLGTAASHGCVRMDNHRIAWLVRTLPPGAPVDVVA